MSIFSKIFRKKIKYDVLVYDGKEWRSILDGPGTAKSIDEVKQDIEVMKSSGFLTDKMQYKVIDDRGNVILMHVPEDEEEKVETYRIEYKIRPTGRWNLYDELPDEPDIAIIDSLANSGKLPAGSQIRVVRKVGRRKEVIYETSVRGVESNEGIVSTRNDVLVINLQQLKQLKQTLDGLREARNVISEVLGDNRQQGNAQPLEFEGKPPWYLHPSFLQQFMPFILSGLGGSAVGGTTNTKKKIEDLDEYLE